MKVVEFMCGKRDINFVFVNVDHVRFTRCKPDIEYRGPYVRPPVEVLLSCGSSVHVVPHEGKWHSNMGPHRRPLSMKKVN